MKGSHATLRFIKKALRRNIPHYSLPALIVQAIVVVGSYGYWDLSVLAPGVAIAGLGFVAVVIAVRSDRLEKTERVVWVVIAFIMLAFEVRTLIDDRTAHDAQQAVAGQLLQDNFAQIGKGIQQSINKSDQHFDTTMAAFAKSEHGTQRSFSATIKSVEEDREAITGTHSFPDFAGLPGWGFARPGEIVLLMNVRGKYPIRGLSAQISKLEKFSLKDLEDMNRDPTAAIQKRLAATQPISISESDMIPGQHLTANHLTPGKYQIDSFSYSGHFVEILDVRLDDRGQVPQTFKIYKNGKLIEEMDKGGNLIPKPPKSDFDVMAPPMDMP